MQNFYFKDFPGGLVDKNPPANAVDTDLIPGWEESTCWGATKVYVPQLLSLCAATPEAHSPRAYVP